MSSSLNNSKCKENLWVSAFLFHLIRIIWVDCRQLMCCNLKSFNRMNGLELVVEKLQFLSRSNDSMDSWNWWKMESNLQHQNIHRKNNLFQWAPVSSALTVYSFYIVHCKSIGRLAFRMWRTIVSFDEKKTQMLDVCKFKKKFS